MAKKQFRPMLAVPVDLNKLRYPVYISPKLDGIRAVVMKAQLISRTLKPIPNDLIRDFFSDRLELEGIDGELIVGCPTAKDVFQRSTSGVMTKTGEPNFRFYVFDVVSAGRFGFSERLSWLRELESAKRITVVPQWFALNLSELQRQHTNHIYQGYEGSIIRSVDGFYKFGRSTVNEGYLLKWKPMEDAEAVVKGFEEKMHNGNGPQKDERGYTKRSSHKSGKVPTGTLGALLVQSPEWPKEFSIGSGFTDSQRSDIWHNKALYLGSSVKFKFQRSGTKDVPRVPTFLGFRSSLDISA